jgi:uncharacterized protein YndB with AHSA1/START domain
MKITVETTVAGTLEDVWRAWTTPDDIRQWNAASDDWHTTNAAVDLRVGGTFSSRMEAKDGSMGFDFAGTYTRIVPHELIEYALGDDRVVLVEFTQGANGVTVRETFDAESSHSIEQQRQGWQAILNNFARHVEALSTSQQDQRPPVGVAHVVLNTDRMEESAQFMRKVGMRPIFDGPQVSVYEMRGGTHLILMMKDKIAAGDAPFDLMVDDLHATHQRFTAMGLAPSPIEARPEIEHEVFTVREPAGHSITFFSSHASGKPT